LLVMTSQYTSPEILLVCLLQEQNQYKHNQRAPTSQSGIQPTLVPENRLYVFFFGLFFFSVSGLRCFVTQSIASLVFVCFIFFVCNQSNESLFGSLAFFYFFPTIILIICRYPVHAHRIFLFGKNSTRLVGTSFL